MFDLFHAPAARIVGCPRLRLCNALDWVVAAAAAAVAAAAAAKIKTAAKKFDNRRATTATLRVNTLRSRSREGVQKWAPLRDQIRPRFACHFFKRFLVTYCS